MNYILPKDKIKPGQILTEEDYLIAANKAFLYAILGWIIPILEIEVFRHADRAKKSNNPEIIKKANRAVNIATVVFFIIVLFPLVILTTLLNLSIGIIIFGFISFAIYRRRKYGWSKRKILIAMVAMILFLVYAIAISISGM